MNSVTCNDCNAINDHSCACLQPNIYNHVNICKEAKLNKVVGPLEPTKNVAHSSSTKMSNLIFDDMQAENDTSSLKNATSKSHNSFMKTHSAGNDDLSTFGLLKRGLRIANLNICHILNKVDELKVLLSEKRSVDILGICETFLNNEVPDELITADGFNFERKDRKGKSGGGILVYVSQLLNYKRRPDLEGEIETIWLEISLPNSKPILYCSAYRPPSAPVAWVDLFTKQIEHASCCGNEVIISGDMNINLMQDPPKYWSDALEVFNFTQVVSCPTRVTENKGTLIDHVYTNRPEYIAEVNVPTIAMSDHYPVCITRSSKHTPNKNSHITIEYRDYKQFNENDFLLELSTANFDKLLECNDPNIVLEGIYNLLNPMLDKHAKVKIKRVKQQNSPKWMNSEINEARHNRDYYHKKKDMENYRKWRNIVTELIRKAKVEYYRDSITQNKCTSDIWKQLKEMTTTKVNNFTINNMTHNGVTSQNQEEIANMYNAYISNLSETLKNNESLPFDEKVLSDYVNSKIPLLQPNFTIGYIHDDQVLKLLSSLNVNKSSGTDNLGPRILKLCAPIIYKVVAYLINLSIKTSIFPDQLKEAKITPIYKKGDKSDPCNYRPISILPTLAKIFEKHLASQIKSYVSEFDLLQKEQSGFREHHSCMTALTKMTETWLSEIRFWKFNGNRVT